MKMKSLVALSALIITSLLLSACSLPFIDVVHGSGNLTTATREVSGFDEIELNGTGRLFIIQGESESLEIEAEDNILPELSSNIKGDTLILGPEGQFWQKAVIPTREIRYTLTVTDLSKITFNGAGELVMNGFNTSDLSVEINGAGQVKFTDLRADNLTVQVSGTGNLELAGEVTSQTISIDGTGNLDAGSLRTAVSSIEVNGLGNATIWVTDTLNVTVNGGGSLSYYGSPNVYQDINGAGSINNLGGK